MLRPLKQGATWNFDGQAGDLKVHQQYTVTGEEDIEVPAGEFHTFRIRGEQSSPSRMTMDRWFAPGTGIVKDVTTMRGRDGDLLERISLELAGRPKIENRPEVKSEAASKRLLRDIRKRSIRETKHDVFIGYTPDLRALAGTALAKGWKGQSGVDRGEHRRRFSTRLQGGRSVSDRRKPKCSWSIHAGTAGRRLGSR